MELVANTLTENDAVANPFQQFAIWFEQAEQAGLIDHTAMHVATVTADGKPDVRVLLLKDFDEQGFVFFTNYQSRKGLELETTPQVCLNFWWDKLARQIRIHGQVERVTSQESDEYFATRLRGSQVGAWASQQSQKLSNRAILEQRVAEIEQQYQGQTIPRPPHWGGYRVRPHEIEFWQGRESRLHDRLRYQLIDNKWQLSRLFP